MAYLIGISLALAVSVFATVVGFDRERVFYAMLLTVIALYYGLFAVIGGSPPALALEAIGISGFVLVSVAGFRTSLWWVALGLALHGVFDAVHGYLITDPGVPSWWPQFCLAYDVMAAAYLAWLLRFGRLAARRAQGSAP